MTTVETITITGLILTFLASVFNTLMTSRNKSAISVVDKKVDDNTEVTNQVKLQTDGMKTELVQTTKLLAEAVGNRIGREELRQENKDDALLHPATPVPVKVVNDPLEVISKEEKKDQK